jgi:uncharacterized membrane protein YfcA
MLQMILLKVIIFLPVGVAAGVLAGMLGVGGGILIVPIMFWCRDLIGLPEPIAQHVAVATSLATIIPTSISSVISHRKHGAVDMTIVRKWIPGIMVGAACGGLSANLFSTLMLAHLFGAVALIVSVSLALPKTPVLLAVPPQNRAGASILSAIIGYISSLMGIGGGTLAVPILAMCSIDVRRAVGTASAFGMAIAVPGIIGYIISGWNEGDLSQGRLGYIDVVIFLSLAVTTIFFAPYGARIAHSIDRQRLRQCFAVFLLITGVRMLLR